MVTTRMPGIFDNSDCSIVPELDQPKILDVGYWENDADVFLTPFLNVLDDFFTSLARPTTHRTTGSENSHFNTSGKPLTDSINHGLDGFADMSFASLVAALHPPPVGSKRANGEIMLLLLKCGSMLF
jgi:hypothetical protein